MLSAGFPYRKEVLDRGLFINSLYLIHHSIDTSEMDSLRLYLKALADEPRVSATSVIMAAEQTICVRKSSAETADALKGFVEWLGKPAVQVEAAKRIDQLMERAVRKSQ